MSATKPFGAALATHGANVQRNALRSHASMASALAAQMHARKAGQARKPGRANVSIERTHEVMTAHGEVQR